MRSLALFTLIDLRLVPTSKGIDSISRFAYRNRRHAAKYNDRVERYNSEGIVRDLLPLALRDRRLVLNARKIDNCLLCRAPNVNEAGLCRVCWVLLDEEELRIARNWMNGGGP